jgi:hypothetical protein
MATSLNANTTKALKNILTLIERKTNFTPQTAPQAKLVKGDPTKLVDDCIALLQNSLTSARAKNVVEPVRTIHHLSCTGGTLIAKCIAALPNTLLLNEVDPLSSMPFDNGKSRFTPTDMVALLRQGDTRPSQEAIIKMFVQQIAFLRKDNASIGRALVVRDHSHSQFLVDDIVSDRPTVRAMLLETMPVRSIVTVRNPIDSYLSMQKHGWDKHFSPPTFEEYCRRHLIFLDKYKKIDIYRYEDFVAEPEKVMKKMCGALDLNYSEKFTRLFGAFQFSGDSGRSGDVIEARARREVEEPFDGGGIYLKLASVLGYKTSC